MGDAEDKCCTTYRNKRQRPHDYSAYRSSSHDYATVGQIVGSSAPHGLTLRRFASVIKSALTGYPIGQSH